MTIYSLSQSIREYLKQKYPGKGGEQKVKSLVNDMANIAFLSARENLVGKHTMLPKQYLGKIRDELGEEVLKGHYIPLDERLWEMENYEEFLAARRRMITAAINQFMKEVEQRSASHEVSTRLYRKNWGRELPS